MKEIRAWSRSVYTYLGAHIPMHVIYFEDLFINPAAELRKIVKFLNVRISNFEERLLCALTDLDSELLKPRNDMNLFETDYVDMINRHIGNVRKTLENQGRDFPVVPNYELLGE